MARSGLALSPDQAFAALRPVSDPPGIGLIRHPRSDPDRPPPPPIPHDRRTGVRLYCSTYVRRLQEGGGNFFREEERWGGDRCVFCGRGGNSARERPSQSLRRQLPPRGSLGWGAPPHSAGQRGRQGARMREGPRGSPLPHAAAAGEAWHANAPSGLLACIAHPLRRHSHGPQKTKKRSRICTHSSARRWGDIHFSPLNTGMQPRPSTRPTTPTAIPGSIRPSKAMIIAMPAPSTRQARTA